MRSASSSCCLDRAFACARLAHLAIEGQSGALQDVFLALEVLLHVPHVTIRRAVLPPIQVKLARRRELAEGHCGGGLWEM